jgi:hypothetical protein
MATHDRVKMLALPCSALADAEDGESGLMCWMQIDQSPHSIVVLQFTWITM